MKIKKLKIENVNRSYDYTYKKLCLFNFIFKSCSISFSSFFFNIESIMNLNQKLRCKNFKEPKFFFSVRIK